MKLSYLERLKLKLSNKKKLLVIGDSHTSVFNCQEFKSEISATMAVVGSMVLDANPSDENTQVVFSVEDSEYYYKVIVERVARSE